MAKTLDLVSGVFVLYNVAMHYIGWTTLLLGAIVFVSPWVIGFSDISLALWSNTVTGLILIITALWHLFGSKPKPPTS